MAARSDAWRCIPGPSTPRRSRPRSPRRATAASMRSNCAASTSSAATTRACRTARCSTSSARRTSRSARSAANTAGCSPRAKRARACSTCWRRPARTRSRSIARRSCARPGPFAGPKSDAIENLKRGADICGKYGLTLAIEFNSQHDVINSHRGAARDPQRRRAAERRHAARRLSSRAQRRRRTRFRRCRAGRDIAFQFSDAPPAPVAAGVKRPTDRLPPGQGIVRWIEVLQLLAEKGYDGHLSYEAPNPALWERSPFEVAREGVQAMRALIAKALQAPAAVR